MNAENERLLNLGGASRNRYGLGVVFDPHRARNGITLTSHVFALRCERVYGLLARNSVLD